MLMVLISISLGKLYGGINFRSQEVVVVIT